MTIYKPRKEEETPIYAYIREYDPRRKMIGFSVKGNIEQNPDFSGNGIFWLSPQDFDELFEELRNGSKIN